MCSRKGKWNTSGLAEAEYGRMRNAVSGLIAVFIMLGVAYIFLRPEILYPGSSSVDPHIQEFLVQLGDSALANHDVPVSAVLVYEEKVVGEGYNTVLRDGNAAGHAEINALTDAIRRFGLTSFMKLNRDSLYLISTFEPCPMCRAAMALYHVKHVEFMKQKSLVYRLREEFGSLLYRFREKKVAPDSLQDLLFRKHPDIARQKF